MTLGSGNFIYNSIADWAKLPAGFNFVEVSGVGVDKQDQVYVFNRGEEPIIILDKDGQFVQTWDKELFVRPHSLYISKDNEVFCVDDQGHTVCKMSTQGERLLTIETRDNPSDTGYIPGDFFSIKRGGPPFNQPTDVALSPDGHIYVSDGYGNASIHKFSPEGEHILSWGEPGDGPGQFFLPHGVSVDDQGLVYIGDRENSRIQIFSPDGQYIDQWKDVRRPNQMVIDNGFMYVAELGYVFTLKNPGPDYSALPSRITVRDLQGKIHSELVEEDPYWAPHGIAMDSQGNLYVGSVSISFSKRTAPADCIVLRKYQRV